MTQKNSQLPEHPSYSHDEKMLSVARQFRHAGKEKIFLQENGPEYVHVWLRAILDDVFKTQITDLEDNSPELTKTIDTIFQKISTHPWVEMEKLKTAEIVDAVLILEKTDGQRISINLEDLWREIFLEPQKAEVQRQTREEEKKLQENVSKEAFLGGSVVLEYSALGTLAAGGAGTAGYKMLNIGKMWAPTDGKRVMVKSLLAKMEDGKTVRIRLKNPYVGTQADFQDAIGKILADVDMDFDPKTHKIFSPANRILQAFDTDLKNLTYEKFLQKNPDSKTKMSLEEFEKFKSETIRENAQFIEDLGAGKISARHALKSTALKVASHIALFPLFAVEFHRQQTPGNMIEAVLEEVWFAFGMRAGAWVGRKLPGWLKIPWSIIWGLVWGMGTVVWGHMAANAWLDTNRHKWLHFQKANYSNGRSVTWHVIFNLGVSEWLWKINDAWRWVTGNKTQDGIDIGIDRTDIKNPLTENHLFTIPEVSIFQDKVTLGTKPWEWMQTAANRDVNRWNEYVDRYKISLTREIYELLGKYQRSEGAFSDTQKIQQAWGKENLLEKTLDEILRWGEEGDVFATQITALKNGIMAEVRKNSPIPNSLINEYIAKSVGAMKIDETLFIKSREEALNRAESQLQMDIDTFPNMTPELKTYIKTIPERILTQRDLYENQYEKRMYESMLKNETMMKLGDTEISVGNYFALWLESAVTWNQEKYFLSQLKSGNTTGFEWSL